MHGCGLQLADCRRVCVCVCVCDAQTIQSKLKLRGSTFLLPPDPQRTHEFRWRVAGVVLCIAAPQA